MYRQLRPQQVQKAVARFVSALAAVATVSLVLASLSGCGNKGDLYLPEDTAATFRSTSNTIDNQSEF